MRRIGVTSGLILAVLWSGHVYSDEPELLILLSAGSQTGDPPSDEVKKEQEKEPTPEQKMARRFPQPVRVGFLIGLPMLDWDDSTIGYIQRVVRTPDGKVQLLVPYSQRLGWLRPTGFFPVKKRLVAVPIETVAILARQVDALDMSREDFDAAPNFREGSATQLPPDELIRIAITRR